MSDKGLIGHDAAGGRNTVKDASDTAAAAVVQGQGPSGTAKAAAGATLMDDEDLSGVLRATNHRRHLWVAISGE